jgi:predicted MFS family arabinose efflux permease
MKSADPLSHSAVRRNNERLILIILAAVQFITIVDFMIVMPLGPELTKAFDIDQTQFGLIVSSYTFAAGIAGLIASALVDRFARRTTFMVLYTGFLLGTFLCGIAPTYEALVAARIATGAFGGILGGLTMTIVGDVFPESRRGRATGSLMTGFALASVAGLPLGLVLGNRFGWHIPFIALAIAGIPALLLTPLAMPRLDAHLGKEHAHPLRSFVEVFSRRNHFDAFALIVALMMGSFTVFPYLSNYLVANAGMPSDQLSLMYIAGGALTLLTAKPIGKLADKYGKLVVFRTIIPLSSIMLIVITHLSVVPVYVTVAVFGALMVFNVGRMIAAMAMITSSVDPRLRGGFMSANSCVQHIACGIAAYLGSVVIKGSTKEHIVGFGTVGFIAAGFTLLSIWLVGRLRVFSPPVSAEEISLAAAAEASNAGEPVMSESFH